jgi:RimJ/RimL family protein N-acetyltransferase
MKIIETSRLILRTWKKEDAQVFFQLNRDEKVIEFLPGSLTKKQVDDFILEMNSQQEKRGYTLFAVELKENGEFIGFIGLNYFDREISFAPAVEIGWRLDSKYWNKGYAFEGAKAVLDFAFNKLGLKEIVSFTVRENLRSENVMKKIGMQRVENGDFQHPKLPSNHRLSWHVLYKIKF